MKNKVVNVDRLNDDLFLMIHDSPELLDEFLMDYGYDPAQLEKNGISKVKAMLFKQKVILKKQQLENLYAKALAHFVSTQAATKEAILQLLKQRAPRLQYNNIEKMDIQDLREILDENDLLELMERIERNDL
jgi:hypothetical protein